MKRRAVLLFWISAAVVAVIGIVVAIFPGSVGAITDDVRRLLSGVDGNAMLAKLIVPAKATLPADGLRKLEAHDWTNPPEMPIPTDEQQADLGLILWRQQLNEMGRVGVNRYVAIPGRAASADDLLAMSNESYRMVGVKAQHGAAPRSAASAPTVSKGGQAGTHARTRERGPLSAEQMKAIHASKRK